MKIAGLLLAAGRSSRFGEQNKLLLPYGNSTVIETSLTNLLNSKVDDIFIITGYAADDSQCCLSSFKSDRLTIVHNDKFDEGRASSIRLAVKTIKDSYDAALFMVADKPGVSSDEINLVIDSYQKQSAPLCYMMTPEGRGHPIVFSSELFDELLRMSGDLVGQELVLRYANRVTIVKSDRVQIDIDTPEEYARALEQLKTESVQL